MAARSETECIHHSEDHIEISDFQDDREIYRGDMFAVIYT